MFKFEKRNTYIDKMIAKTVIALQDHEPDSKEYGVILDRLVQLQKIREEEKPRRLSPDTALLAATNIAGILMIVHHEHLGVITTKAMSMIVKPK